MNHIHLSFLTKYFALEFSQRCGHVRLKPGHNCATLLNPDCEEPAKEVNHLKKVADSSEVGILDVCHIFFKLNKPYLKGVKPAKCRGGGEENLELHPLSTFIQSAEIFLNFM